MFCTQNLPRTFFGSFFPMFYFHNMAGFVFGFVLGSFFQQVRIFNNFPASLLGSFGFVFSGRCFVINNFPASFFKKRVFLSHNFSSKTCTNVFSNLQLNLESVQTV